LASESGLFECEAWFGSQFAFFPLFLKKKLNHHLTKPDDTAPGKFSKFFFLRVFCLVHLFDWFVYYFGDLFLSLRNLLVLGREICLFSKRRFLSL